MEKPKSIVCRVCGKRVRTRKGSAWSNRATIYPADHKNAAGAPCDGWSSALAWHLAADSEQGA